MATFKQMLQASMKSKDTEEWLDVYFTRPIGLVFTLLWRRLGVHPTVITVLGMALGAAAGWMFWHTELEYNIWGIVLMMLSNFCDSTDGQLARLTGKKTLVGRVLDGAVDIRKGSPSFGQQVAVELTQDNHRQFFIPRGFAHGFSVLSDVAVFQYKCDNYYCPASEGAIAWDDPALGIDWRIPADKAILSPKDAHHPLLKDSPYLFDYPLEY